MREICKGEKTVEFAQGLLPFLVPAKKGERQDGIANFYVNVQRDKDGTTSSQSDSTPVRLVADAELLAAKKLLSLDDFEALIGILELKQGYETDDEILRRQGAVKLWRFHPHCAAHYAGSNKPVDTWIAEKLSRSLDFARNLLSVVATEKLKAVHLVMCGFVRYPEKPSLSPALYAENLQTAIFVRALIGNMRACPYCSSLFLTPKLNKFYCSTACRDTFRAARAYKRQKANEGKARVA